MNAPLCPSCGHRHVGQELGYVCPGCQCLWRPDHLLVPSELEDFNRRARTMRRVTDMERAFALMYRADLERRALELTESRQELALKFAEVSARLERCQSVLALALDESACDGDLCAHQWHEDARNALGDWRGPTKRADQPKEHDNG